MLRTVVLLAGLGAALIIGGWQPASGGELLINGDFEAGTTGWGAPYGELTTVSSPVHEGSASGRLAGDSPVTQLVYQWVDVGPGQTYEFSGWVLLDDPSVSYVFLRIRWYDAGGSPLTPFDSPWLTGFDSSFRFVSTGALVSPPQAHKAWLNVFVQPSGPFEVYLDDFSFQGPPPSPSPTPTATPTPTPTPTSTPSPTPTATPSSPGPTPVATTTPLPPEPTATPQAAEPKVFPSLVNGGFEELREDGTPYGWRKVGGEMSVSDAFRVEGARSATLVSRTQSTKWVYQTVSVKGGAFYRLRSSALKNDPGVREVLLRISWYESADGSGSQISTADSPALADNSPGFVVLDTEPVQAPSQARSAKVRLLLRPESAAPAVVYFDDVRFGETDAPMATSSADGGVGTLSAAERDLGGGAEEAGPATPAGTAALSAWAAPTSLANVRQEPRTQDMSDASGGRPLWPLLLAFGVPAAGLAAMAGHAWRRARLAGRNGDHL